MEDRYLLKEKRVDWREFPEKEQWITGCSYSLKPNT